MLDKLISTKEIKLPAKVGYICLKDRNLLKPYYDAILESRQKVVTEYLITDEEGNSKVPDGKIEEANSKLLEILDMEEDDIPTLQKFNINDISSESFSLEILDALMPIIEE